jgi:hypothetical protein
MEQKDFPELCLTMCSVVLGDSRQFRLRYGVIAQVTCCVGRTKGPFSVYTDNLKTIIKVFEGALHNLSLDSETSS